MRRAAPVTSTTRGPAGAPASDRGSGEAVIYNAGMNQNAHEPASLPVPAADALDASAALAAHIREAISQAGGWLPFDR
ncbi:MAG: class I SAM-dependent methyltransferase, partial [Trinickia sp.]